MIIKLVLTFIFGAVWALIGLTISTIVPNRYVAIISPFLLYQTLWKLLDRTSIAPLDTLSGNTDFPLWGIVCLQILMIASAVYLFSFMLKRRLENV